jgi:hypothetical protein
MSSADLPRPDALSSLPGRNPDVIEAQRDRLGEARPVCRLLPPKRFRARRNLPRCADPGPGGDGPQR